MPEPSQELATLESQRVPTIEHFKSIYYWVNAKPDSAIKILEGKKIIELSSLFDINNRINEKLSNHEVQGTIVTVNVIFEKNDIKSFSNFSQFQIENWNLINEPIRHITMTWDMIVKLPMLELPQRHTLKLKIGDALPPKDVFHLMFTSEDETELAESRADAVVKVDFINQVLASELLERVHTWYSGLKDINYNSSVKFLKDKEDEVLGIISKFFPLVLIGIFMLLLPKIQSYGYLKVLSVNTLTLLAVILLVLYALNDLLSRFLVRHLNKKINALKSAKPFLISNGDKLYKDKLDTENKTLLSQIKTKIVIALVMLPVTLITKYIIKYFNL